MTALAHHCNAAVPTVQHEVARLVGDVEINAFCTTPFHFGIDGARDDSVIFSVYPGEDIVEAGARALGVCVSEALNTKQVTA